MNYRFLCLCICLLPWSTTCTAEADRQRTIYFGQSAPLTGPAQALGHEVRAGIRAAFQEYNRYTEANVRIELITRDDQYEPESAINNANYFINRQDIIGLIGSVGTPTSLAILDLVEARQIAYLAPVTGSTALRKPQLNSVLNIRASYDHEIEAMVKWLADVHDSRSIGLLYQDDSYGRVGLNALQRMADAGQIDLVASAPYLRNSTAIKRPLLTLAAAQPDAVIMVCTYQVATTFMRWSAALGFSPLFLNLSFVGSEAIARTLGATEQQVYNTQVVPSPFGRSDVVRRYRTAMADYDNTLPVSHLSLEGYLAGRVAGEIIDAVPGTLSRQTFHDAMNKLTELSINGLHLPLSKRPHRVYLTRLNQSGQFLSAQ